MQNQMKSPIVLLVEQNVETKLEETSDTEKMKEKEDKQKEEKENTDALQEKLDSGKQEKK